MYFNFLYTITQILASQWMLPAHSRWYSSPAPVTRTLAGGLQTRTRSSTLPLDSTTRLDSITTTHTEPAASNHHDHKTTTIINVSINFYNNHTFDNFDFTSIIHNFCITAIINNFMLPSSVVVSSNKSRYLCNHT